jgi:hypothetical protein
VVAILQSCRRLVALSLWDDMRLIDSLAFVAHAPPTLRHLQLVLGKRSIPAAAAVRDLQLLPHRVNTLFLGPSLSQRMSKQQMQTLKEAVLAPGGSMNASSLEALH